MRSEERQRRQRRQPPQLLESTNPTAVVLRAALVANQQVQRQLRWDLAHLSGRKRDNRLEATRCIAHAYAAVTTGVSIVSTVLSSPSGKSAGDGTNIATANTPSVEDSSVFPTARNTSCTPTPGIAATVAARMVETDHADTTTADNDTVPVPVSIAKAVLQGMKVKELHCQLRHRLQPITGVKTVLQERLKVVVENEALYYTDTQLEEYNINKKKKNNNKSTRGGVDIPTSVQLRTLFPEEEEEEQPHTVLSRSSGSTRREEAAAASVDSSTKGKEEDTDGTRTTKTKTRTRRPREPLRADTYEDKHDQSSSTRNRKGIPIVEDKNAEDDDTAETRTKKKTKENVQNRPRQPLPSATHDDTSSSSSTTTNVVAPEREKTTNSGDTSTTTTTTVTRTRQNCGELQPKTPQQKRIWSNNTRKNFRYNPQRRWTMDYFSDPTGSRPLPNADTLRRQQYGYATNVSSVTAAATTTSSTPTQNQPPSPIATAEKEEQPRRRPDTFFYHTRPPFTEREKTFLDQLLHEKNSSSSDAVKDQNSRELDPSSLSSSWGTEYDYATIARRLRDEHHDNRKVRKRDKMLVPTCVPRTAEEIQLYHRHRWASRYPFTKRDSLIILAEVVAATAKTTATNTTIVAVPVVAAAISTVPSKQSATRTTRSSSPAAAVALMSAKQDQSEKNRDEEVEDDDDGVTENNPPAPPNQQQSMKLDWERICNRVIQENQRVRAAKGHSNNSSSSNTTNGNTATATDTVRLPDVSRLITPYQCMVHYKTQLRPTPDGTFTRDEDEVLLRYIAAMGPQYKWGYPQIQEVTSRLFPYKPAKRIYDRTHNSQWHPVSKDTYWTKEEEMKLVLAMKMYTDDDDEYGASGSHTKGPATSSAANWGDGNGTKIAAERAALRRAAAHFHPQRQAGKVAKKWERSFSPRFCYAPFTNAEDTKLLEVVNSLDVSAPFTEVATYFPDRSADQILQRWHYIASDKDIAEKRVPTVIRKGIKRGLLDNRTRKKRTRSDAKRTDSARDDDGVIFDTSDFAVELIRSNRTTRTTRSSSKYQNAIGNSY